MIEFIDEHLPPVVSALEAFPFESPRAYADLAAQTYYYTSHSTRLLARSAARFGVEDEKLHTRFAAHMVEEKSHHLLARHDVEALGFRLDDFSELVWTKAMYQRQYYLCDDREPTDLLGYILMLEYVAVRAGANLGKRIVGTHGKKAAAFILVHAEDDKEHTEDAIAHTAQLSERRVTGIKDNFLCCRDIYMAMLDAVRKRSG